MTEQTISPRPWSFKHAPESHAKMGFGILNKYGNFWTPTVFDTPKEALDYVTTYCTKNWPTEPHLLNDYKVVRAQSVTTLIPESLTYHAQVYRHDVPLGERRVAA